MFEISIVEFWTVLVTAVALAFIIGRGYQMWRENVHRENQRKAAAAAELRSYIAKFKKAKEETPPSPLVGNAARGHLPPYPDNPIMLIDSSHVTEMLTMFDDTFYEHKLRYICKTCHLDSQVPQHRPFFEHPCSSIKPTRRKP